MALGGNYNNGGNRNSYSGNNKQNNTILRI